MPLQESPFGKDADGTPVRLFRLSSDNISASLMTYGATLVSLEAPDQSGEVHDVVLGFDSLDGYLAEHPYFGCIVGRYANRIARGELVIDGKMHRLACNDGDHHLHGGVRGFNRRHWDARATGEQVVFSYSSADGEEGYPGTLQVNVTYSLEDEDTLRIDYEATTDQPTAVNLTNHAYFNLSRDESVLGHELLIDADAFLPVQPGVIPTGEMRPVADGPANGPMDFRSPAVIGNRLASSDRQLELAGGFDHNWVLHAGTGMRRAALLREPASGRQLEVLTTQPGLQFYDGHLLDGSLSGKLGRRYGKHAGLCLETQHFPDSPHHPAFPGTVLRPGQAYRHTTLYRLTHWPPYAAVARK